MARLRENQRISMRTQRMRERIETERERERKTEKLQRPRTIVRLFTLYRRSRQNFLACHLVKARSSRATSRGQSCTVLRQAVRTVRRSAVYHNHHLTSIDVEGRAVRNQTTDALRLIEAGAPIERQADLRQIKRNQTKEAKHEKARVANKGEDSRRHQCGAL